MTYESGRKIGVLPQDLHRLGKALAKGSSYKSIADAVMDSAALRQAVEDRLCSDVNTECKRLCSKTNPTLLRTATKDNVLNFSWHAKSRGVKFVKSRRYFIVFSWLRPIQGHFLKAATLNQLKGTLVFVLRLLSCSKTATKA